MELLHTFNSYPAVYIACMLVLGLLIGSFLNVVIHRLPKMLENDWRQQCHEFLELEHNQDTESNFSLSSPASSCPHCGHKIRAWENIPILSYLFLRGKCSNCHKNISARYPLVELTTGLLTAMVAWHFGVSWAAFWAMCLTWSLIALSMIDFDTKLLPDNITLPFLWLGILVNINNTFTSLENSVIGAAAGYLVLWSIYQVHHRLTGKEGMGFGDFKLLAMLGAWMGWQSLLLIVLLSSLVGAIVGITLIVAMGRDRHVAIPFGPYLATAGFISLIWGEGIIRAYLGISGLSQ